MKLVNARVASRANRQPIDVDGDNADQRPEYPVRPAMPAGKRVDRIGREPVPQASLPTPRSAQSPQPKPRFAVFHRLLPPDETHHQNRSDQERPTERVNNAKRRPEEFRVGSEHGVVCKFSGPERTENAKYRRIRANSPKWLANENIERKNQQTREQSTQRQHENQRAENGLGLVAAHGRHEHSRGEREQNGVHDRQSDPRIFAWRDAAQQHRNAQGRQHRHQSVEAGQRRGGPLAEHDVEAPQIGQEQKAQRAFAFLRADAIRRDKRPDQQAVSERHDGQRGEQRFAQGDRRLSRSWE